MRSSYGSSDCDFSELKSNFFQPSEPTSPSEVPLDVATTRGDKTDVEIDFRGGTAFKAAVAIVKLSEAIKEP
jgi:hypothetical protein